MFYLKRIIAAEAQEVGFQELTCYNFSILTGLRADRDYKFRVFAETASGLSEPSMPATFYRKPGT